MWIDKFSIRNLELFSSSGQGCSLAEVLDKTCSPMGARMLRRWISLPLKNVADIQARQEIVSLLMEDESLRDTLGEAIEQVGDLERIISRVAVGRVTPREVVQLKTGSLCRRNHQDLVGTIASPTLAETGPAVGSVSGDAGGRSNGKSTPIPPIRFKKGA